MSYLIIDALAANEGLRRFSRDAIGVGPRLIAGIIESKKENVKIVRAEDLIGNKKVDVIEYDKILISAMSVDLIAVERTIERIRTKSKAKIVIGGPIANEVSTIKHLKADLIVKGEGEEIIDELLANDFEIGNVNHERIRTEEYLKGKYILSLKGKSRKDIFETFKPSVERIKDYPEYQSAKVYVEIVRGCSNHYRGELVKNSGGCIDCGNCDSPDIVKQASCPVDIPPGCGFCSVPATFGPPRSRPLELILKEVEELLAVGVRRIMLSAPGFLDYMRGENDQEIVSPNVPPANIQKIEELLDKLAEIRDKQPTLCSIAVENVKPSLVTEEIAKIMGKYLPNTPISIGCETFNTQHSMQIGRPSSPGQAIEAARMFSKYGLKPQIYLIHSMPGETVQALNDTIRTVKNDLWDVAEKITVYKYQKLPDSPFTKTHVPEPIPRHLLIKKREELKEAIREFNFKKKQAMVGKKLQAIIAEKDFTNPNYLVAHPLHGGLVIKIKANEETLNKIVKVKIIKALNDRIVAGEIVE